MKQWLLGLLLAFSGITAAHAVPAAESKGKVVMCAFDPIGRNGPLFQSFDFFKREALGWGVDIELKPYVDERVAAEDFNAGQCDIVNLPGFRARNYNSFTGSIDSFGTLPSYDHLRAVIQVLATDKATPLMTQGEFEVLSVIPAGSIFMFVNDKNINSPETMAGKTIGVLDNAPELPRLVALAGMTPVASALTNLYGKFNSGNVDATAGPALIFEPFELRKGLGKNGGILDYPFMQSTIQIIARHQKLPAGFGKQARQYGERNFDQALEMILGAEKRIPQQYWVHIARENAIAWNEVFRKNRLKLRDDAIYDARALTLFRKVRCSVDAALPECSAPDKE